MTLLHVVLQVARDGHASLLVKLELVLVLGAPRGLVGAGVLVLAIAALDFGRLLGGCEARLFPNRRAVLVELKRMKRLATLVSLLIGRGNLTRNGMTASRHATPPIKLPAPPTPSAVNICSVYRGAAAPMDERVIVLPAMALAAYMRYESVR